MADHMPFDRFLYEFPLFRSFLDVVLAEKPNSSLYGSSNFRNILRFGRSKNPDSRRVSATLCSRLANALQNLLIIGLDIDHERPLNITSDPINHSHSIQRKIARR